MLRRVPAYYTTERKRGTVEIDVTSSVEFYRAEAEFWVLQAKKEGKKDR
jgi:hypothetical protein